MKIRMPDATANNGTLHVTLDNSGGDLRLEFELRDRDGTLAMFESPDSFTVTGGPESKVIDVATAGRNFSPGAITGKWLVTDKRYGVDARYFSPIDSGGADLQFLIEGNSLYISGLPPGAPDAIRSRRPQASGATLPDQTPTAWSRWSAPGTPWTSVPAFRPAFWRRPPPPSTSSSTSTPRSRASTGSMDSGRGRGRGRGAF